VTQCNDTQRTKHHAERYCGHAAENRDCNTGQDAEFVAFGIGERDPAAAIGPPVVGLLRGPEREDPIGLLLARAICRPQVQVHAVLHRLAIRDGDEQQQLAPVARHDEAFLVPWLVRVIRVLGEVQHLRPEDRLCVRIPGVDRRVRYSASHGGSLNRRCGAVKRFTRRPDGPGAQEEDRFTTRSG
jgi:hypothetical protein